MRCIGLSVCGALITLALVAFDAVPVGAVAYDVPNTHATVQLAVADAAISPDVYNVITISQSPVVTFDTINIGNDFDIGRRLVIRPAANLTRATIANENPLAIMFIMDFAGYVTLQDLDILRNVTNGATIIAFGDAKHITIERCRIGSNWDATGTTGHSNISILYPVEILLRNNILFANAPGTFDYGLNVSHIEDPGQSLRLYNNDISDYRLYGVTMDGPGNGALLLLRNNVVANNATLNPEPFAFRTDVNTATVVSSHNAVYASAPMVQVGAGQDLAGTAANFINLPRANIAASFVTVNWTMVFDANPDYYRLLDLGPLHDAASDYGMTVTLNDPDIEVDDDIELDYRPGGVELHTDRGADQLEPGTGNSDVGPSRNRMGLEAAPVANPAHEVSIAYTTRSGGVLELSVFDPAGRLLYRKTRSVEVESHGTFVWPDPKHSGVAFYRLRLDRLGGGIEETTGRVTLVR